MTKLLFLLHYVQIYICVIYLTDGYPKIVYVSNCLSNTCIKTVQNRTKRMGNDPSRGVYPGIKIKGNCWGLVII